MQIVKNHKYWLCLEPYVFVFGGKDNYMLYNGFAHKYIIINNIKENKDIISVLDKMMDMGNMYCVCLSSQKLATEKFSTFINDIRNGFYGDIYDEKIFETRPAIFPPIVNVKNSYVNINKEEELPRKSNLERFLHELTIYINGQCKNNCKNCSDYCKQLLFCTKGNDEMSEEIVKDIVNAIKTTKIAKVNIVGGDIFSYKPSDYLLCKLEEIGSKIEFYTHLQNLDLEKAKKILKLGFALCICVTGNANKNEIKHIQHSLAEYKDLVKWKFIVTSEEELDNFNRLSGDDETNCLVYPYYNGNNVDFFKKYVFNKKSDFKGIDLSCEDVFKRQLYNLYDYGKLVITPNKQVYANLNFPSIGIFEDDFMKFTKLLLTDDSPWFRTRKKIKPCNDCAFRYLCASPSNYEIALNRNNLCTIIK